MRLIRYNHSPFFTPSSSFTGLREEMDRLFDAAFPALTSLRRDGYFGEAEGEFPIDLYQDKDAFVVRAELPGFRKEDLSVDVADGVLTVSAHQKSETQGDGKDKTTTAQERRLSRAISLPEHLQADKIKAAYENGVLTVTLPKSEAVKPRQVTIDVK